MKDVSEVICKNKALIERYFKERNIILQPRKLSLQSLHNKCFGMLCINKTNLSTYRYKVWQGEDWKVYVDKFGFSFQIENWASVSDAYHIWQDYYYNIANYIKYHL